ncbi:MAG: tetratricopeptide repeat protein [Candidatus Gastranaerophilales bacterium]|nr:tetratricopeptide repeat protein [Candidatus Gastranaerophilales bacterium]
MLTVSCTIGFANKSQDFDDIVKRLISKGQYKEAADMMNKAVIKSQDDIKTQINVAWIYAFNKHYKEALNITDKIIKINPKYQELYYLRGFAFQKTENYQLAIKSFKTAISLNPRDIKSYNSLAEVYQIKEKYDDSIYYYQLASKLQPENYVYYLDLANIYFKKRDFKKSLIEAQNAYNYAPLAEKEKISDILENIKLSAILGQNK